MAPVRKSIIVYIVLIEFFFVQTAQIYAQPAPGPFDAAKAGAMLADYFEFVAATRAGLDRSLFDVTAQADQPGSVAAAFFFVKNEIRYQDYAGSLRGARGTLESGAGNSVDQSLLLFELIKALGGEAWLASGTISPAKQDLLRRQMYARGNAFKLPNPGPEPSEQQIRDLARVFSVDPKRLATSLQAQAEHAGGVRSVLSEITRNTSEVLQQGLELVSARQPVVEVSAPQLPHVWVQYRNAGGRTVDLDPSFDDSIFGSAYAPVSNTWTELPPEMQQSVRVALIIEALTETGQLELDILWRLDLEGEKITTTDIQFEIIPDRIDLDALTAGNFNNDTILGQVGRDESFQPRFKVDGNIVGGHKFFGSGRRSQTGTEPEPSGLGGGLFGGLTRRLETTVNQMSPSDLTALWFEVVSKRPGANGEMVMETRRSFIYDRLTPQSRISGDNIAMSAKPFRAIDLVVSGGIAMSGFVRSPAALVDAASERLLAARQVIDERLSGANDEYRSIADEGAAMARAWHQLSESLAAANSPVSNQVCIYHDRPRTVVYLDHIGQAQDAAPIRTRSMDILAHRFAVRAVTEARGLADDFIFRQGIADTLAETWLIDTDKRTISAQTVLAEAYAGGVDMLVLTPADAARIEPLALNRAAKAYLRQDLNNGHIVIVPAGPTDPHDRRIAWWRYNTTNGSILGVGEQGKGNAMLEYLEPLTLSGALVGLPVALVVTAGVCGGFTAYHGQGFDYFKNCMAVAIMTEILAIMAIAFSAALGGSILLTVGLMFFAGVTMAVYGLATDNAFVRDVGVGLALTPVLTPVGVAFGRHILTPAAREFVEQIRNIRQAVRRPPLDIGSPVPAMAGAGRGFTSGVDPAGNTVFMSGRGRNFGSRRPSRNWEGQRRPSVPLDEALNRALGREQARQVEQVADDLLYCWLRLPGRWREIQFLERQLDQLLRDLPRYLQRRVNQKIYLARQNGQTYRGIDFESLVPTRRPGQSIDEWIGVNRLSDNARQTARQGTYRNPTSWRANQATPDIPPSSIEIDHIVPVSTIATDPQFVRAGFWRLSAAGKRAVLDYQPNLQPLDSLLNSLRQERNIDQWAQLMEGGGKPLSGDYILWFRQQEAEARRGLIDLIHRLVRLENARLLPPPVPQSFELLLNAA